MTEFLITLGLLIAVIVAVEIIGGFWKDKP